MVPNLLSPRDGLSNPTNPFLAVLYCHPHLQISSLPKLFPQFWKMILTPVFLGPPAGTHEQQSFLLLSTTTCTFSQPYCLLVIFLLFLLNFVTRLLQGIVLACLPFCSLVFIQTALTKVNLLMPMR